MSTRTHRVKNPRRHPRSYVLQVLIGLCVFLAGISLTLAWVRADRQAVEATGQSRELADPILELCAQGGTVARALAAEGRCALAEQVTNQEVVDPLPAGPDRDEIVRLIEAEVAQLSLPPGRGPTSGQLLDIARQVVLENSELLRGPAGPEVSDVRLAAVVNAYFEANPPPPGRDGTNGINGRDGIDGQDGDAGQPPAGWVTEYPDGAREECSRAEPFDPGAPRYSCTFTPAPTEPEPTTPPPTTENEGGGPPFG